MSQFLIMRDLRAATADRTKWIGRATWGLFVLLVVFNLIKTIGKTKSFRMATSGPTIAPVVE